MTQIELIYTDFFISDYPYNPRYLRSEKSIFD